MAYSLEDRVRSLEREIQERDQFIAASQGFSLVRFLLGWYVHDTKNMIARLSGHLFTHFEICRRKGDDELAHRKGDDELIREITREFELLRDYHETLKDVLWACGADNRASIGECIHAATRLIELYGWRRRVTLTVELDPNTGNRRVPSQEFTSVLILMLMNAVAVSETDTRECHIVVRTVSDSKSTSLMIIDDGHGIDPSELKEVWELGSNTRVGRHGLGIPWAKMFVEISLGGQITVESKPGEFTKIEITLPEEPERNNENTPLD